MECHDARPLIPGYLDGEISEAQAAPLRQHLLECGACRASAQDGKALKEWFVDDGPVEVPAGFAARVARRAFAGDRGVGPVLVDSADSEGTGARGEGRVLSFVLQLTAAAAVLLIALSIGIRAIELPSGGELHADGASKDWALQGLDRLNQAEDEQEEDEETEEAAFRDPGERRRG